MSQLHDWWMMGGYACYVWPAYGLALVVLGLNSLHVSYQRTQTRKKLSDWFKRQ